MFVSYLLFVNKDHIASSSSFLNMCYITFVLFDIFLYTLSSPASLCVSLRLPAPPCVSLRLSASLCVPCASLALPNFSPPPSPLLLFSSLTSCRSCESDARDEGDAGHARDAERRKGRRGTQKDAGGRKGRRETQEDAGDAGNLVDGEEEEIDTQGDTSPRNTRSCSEHNIPH